MRERISKLEVSVAALSGIVVFVATLTGPRLSHGVSRDTLAITNARQEQQISELQANLQAAQGRTRALQAELVEAQGQSEQLDAQVNTLKREREMLTAQLGAATEKVQALEEKLQTVDQEAAQLKELLSVQEANKERAEAEARAKKAEERIRELTLELHRAGVWP